MLELKYKRKGAVPRKARSHEERKKGACCEQAPVEPDPSSLEVDAGDHSAPTVGVGNDLVVDPELTAGSRVGTGLRVVSPTLLAEVAVEVAGQAGWAGIGGGAYSAALDNAIRRQFTGK